MSEQRFLLEVVVGLSGEENKGSFRDERSLPHLDPGAGYIGDVHKISLNCTLKISVLHILYFMYVLSQNKTKYGCTQLQL